jgi:hypothetical protein
MGPTGGTNNNIKSVLNFFPCSVLYARGYQGKSHHECGLVTLGSGTQVAYTQSLTYPHKKKFRGVTSGEREGQEIGRRAQSIDPGKFK